MDAPGGLVRRVAGVDELAAKPRPEGVDGRILEFPDGSERHVDGQRNLLVPRLAEEPAVCVDGTLASGPLAKR